MKHLLHLSALTLVAASIGMAEDQMDTITAKFKPAVTDKVESASKAREITAAAASDLKKQLEAAKAKFTPGHSFTFEEASQMVLGLMKSLEHYNSEFTRLTSAMEDFDNMAIEYFSAAVDVIDKAKDPDEKKILTRKSKEVLDWLYLQSGKLDEHAPRDWVQTYNDAVKFLASIKFESAPPKN